MYSIHKHKYSTVLYGHESKHEINFKAYYDRYKSSLVEDYVLYYCFFSFTLYQNFLT